MVLPIEKSFNCFSCDWYKRAKKLGLKWDIIMWSEMYRTTHGCRFVSKVIYIALTILSITCVHVCVSRFGAFDFTSPLKMRDEFYIYIQHILKSTKKIHTEINCIPLPYNLRRSIKCNNICSFVCTFLSPFVRSSVMHYMRTSIAVTVCVCV